MNDCYLAMIRNEKTDHTPVWYMRQAGRSQAEYRKIKKTHSLFDITHDPELCAYVTELPVKEYGVDAAILYKDIMTPLLAMGVGLSIKPGIGPVMDKAMATTADVEALGVLEDEGLAPILETIKILTTGRLTVPLIGFSGAPFTLASYLIEGGPSKQYMKTKRFMVENPEGWDLLMDKLATMMAQYVQAQIKAGVNAIQIFDSWVGAVSVRTYERYIFPHMLRALTMVKEAYPQTPITIFGVETGHLLSQFTKLPVDVIGLDWRTSFWEARHRGVTQMLQGNLDPAYLFAPWERTKEEIDHILEETEGRCIFNLGHGIVPEANPERIRAITEYVHEQTTGR